jgi:hypothetical protein
MYHYQMQKMSVILEDHSKMLMQEEGQVLITQQLVLLGRVRMDKSQDLGLLLGWVEVLDLQ